MIDRPFPRVVYGEPIEEGDAGTFPAVVQAASDTYLVAARNRPRASPNAHRNYHGRTPRSRAFVTRRRGLTMHPVRSPTVVLTRAGPTVPPDPPEPKRLRTIETHP